MGERAIDRSIDRSDLRSRIENFSLPRCVSKNIDRIRSGGEGGKKEKKEKQKRVALVANDSIIGGSRLTLSKLEIHR